MPSIEQLAEFSANHVFLVSALAGGILLLLFSEVQRKARGMVDLPPQDVVRLMNADAEVIDVRNAESFKKGHLVNARNVPLEQIVQDSEKISSTTDKALVAVCDNGYAAAKAATAMRKAGYEKAFSLKGGLAAWQQENLPLVTEKKKQKKKNKGSG